MRTLPPWEANRYFELPSYTEYTVPVAGAISIALANPRRVSLVVCTQSSSTVQTVIAPSSNLTTGGGIPIGPTIPFSITHNEYGVLVQSEWFARNTVGGSNVVSVIEVILRDWPQNDPADRDDVNDMLALIYQQIKALSRQIGKQNGDNYALSSNPDNGYRRNGSYLEYLRNLASGRQQNS